MISSCRKKHRWARRENTGPDAGTAPRPPGRPKAAARARCAGSPATRAPTPQRCPARRSCG
jgi:hypothetical protein